MLTIIPANDEARNAAFAHPDARHGYGVFETVRVEILNESKNESKSESSGTSAHNQTRAQFSFGLLPLHYERLSAGAAFLGLGEPPPFEVLRATIEQRAALFAEQNARQKPETPNGGRVIAANVVAVTGELRVFCRVLDALGGAESGGVTLVISRSVRRLSGSAATRFKTLSYVDNRLLMREAASAGATDAIAPNERGRVTDGGRFTIFAIAGGRLLTPSAECGALPGVARRVFLEAGLAEEAELSAEDLLKSDALFIANSLRGVLPVLSIDSAPKSVNRPWLQALTERYRSAAEAARALWRA